jgi:uncharacterized membrane protein YfcA
MLPAPFDGMTTGTLAGLALFALVAGLARGFSGFGAALIFMPLASALVGPRMAAPMLMIIDAVTSLGLVPRALSASDKPEVGVMTLGTIVGVPLGAAALTRTDPVLIRWIIAAMIVAMLALLMSGWRYRGRPAAPLTVLIGAVSGLFSGIAQIGGPPVVAYWLGSAAAAVTVRANVILFFALSNVVSFTSYWFGGLLTSAVIAAALVTGPAYGLGLFIGARLFGRASEIAFRRVCYALIAGALVLSLPVLDQVIRG